MRRFLIFLCCCLNVLAQKQPEDWTKKPVCGLLQQNIKSLPKEVHFSVTINEAHEVILELTHASFYEKIWSNPNMGVAIQLVPKSLYNCKENVANKKAIWMPSLFLSEMNNRKKLVNKSIEINIGKAPLSYQNEVLEGNIAFLTNGNICEFLYFIDLESANFTLLPMGFYTDVMHQKLEKSSNSSVSLFKSSIPFEKNKSEFNVSDFETTKAYLISNKANITKIEINSYASVEGDLELNLNLYQNRSENVLKAINEVIKNEILIETKASENWEDFNANIENTPFGYLKFKTNEEVKSILKNKDIQSKIEEILKKTRNTSILIYTKNNDYNQLINAFNESILKQDVKKAQSIQQILFNENQNPNQFLNKIESPQNRIFADILNDEIVFKNELKLIDNQKALAYFDELIKKEPENLKFNYNAAVLSLKIWDTIKTDSLAESNCLNRIKNLQKLGLNSVLYDRMMINFHLIRSVFFSEKNNFKEKDNSVSLVLKKYKSLILSDEDALALAKYLVYFDLKPAAFELIETKFKQSPSEEIIFYYLNLLLFENSVQNQQEIIQKAVGLNQKRFCHLFDSVNEGGASFQLLQNKNINSVYCAKCQ